MEDQMFVANCVQERYGINGPNSVEINKLSFYFLEQMTKLSIQNSHVTPQCASPDHH